jgi:peptidoglycan/xylan/chitin deacetylase (PgdA/CDA1 family)
MGARGAVAAITTGLTGAGARRTLKRGLAGLDGSRRPGPTTGTTVLIYHRVAGGTPDERDVRASDFAAQVDALRGHRVVSLDDALDELDRGDDTPKVVLTFDDGFADVHTVAWPQLRAASLPFTLYVTTAYIGGTMHWPGSTSAHPGPGLSWEQLAELAADPLVTVGNHTHTHARPDALSADELDRCSALLEERLGVVPQHFCFTWGVPVPSARPLLQARFRSATTGTVGRNHPSSDRLELARVPVRGSDPLPFFRAKLTGDLRAEHLYERLVGAAKGAGLRG